MHVSAIIASGGEGRRFSSATPKQFLKLDKRPVLACTIFPFNRSKKIDEIVVVVPPKDILRTQKDIVKRYGYDKVSAVVAGGLKRQDSVYNALKAISARTDIVIVHDGVRPFIKVAEIEEGIRKAAKNGTAVFAIRARNTVKKVLDSGEIVKTVPRQDLYEAQTPQIFEYRVLLDAYKEAFDEGYYSTDDSALLERMGKKVMVHEGSPDNIKITYPGDLVLARAILKNWRW